MRQKYQFDGLAPDDWPNAYRRAKRTFLQLLKSGESIALEDAIRDIRTDERIDRRRFGAVVFECLRAGQIVRSGYRSSANRKHHSGTKTLWVLAEKAKGQTMRDDLPTRDCDTRIDTPNRDESIEVRRTELIRQVIAAADLHELPLVIAATWTDDHD